MRPGLPGDFMQTIKVLAVKAKTIQKQAFGLFWNQVKGTWQKIRATPFWGGPRLKTPRT